MLTERTDDIDPGSGSRPSRSEPAVVLEPLPNKMLLVETRGGAKVAVHASGAMRIAVVRLVPGDAVRIERSPFDASKGRIVGIDRGRPRRVRSAPNETRRDHDREAARSEAARSESTRSESTRSRPHQRPPETSP